MSRLVVRALLTTSVVVMFVVAVGRPTLVDTAVVAVMVYPFAHLFCRHVVGE